MSRRGWFNEEARPAVKNENQNGERPAEGLGTDIAGVSARQTPEVFVRGKTTIPNSFSVAYASGHAVGV